MSSQSQDYTTLFEHPAHKNECNKQAMDIRAFRTMPNQSLLTSENASGSRVSMDVFFAVFQSAQGSHLVDYQYFKQTIRN
jgi:hypothetical protein